MADKKSLTVHVGDMDWDLAMNLILATDALARVWAKENSGRRYGINLRPAGEGKAELEFAGWQNG
jgi:hypothetical protein